MRLLSGGLDIHIGTDFTLNFAMGRFKGPDVFPYQNQNVAVDTAAFIIGHKADFLQHFLFNSDGDTFYRHKITPLRHIMRLFYGVYVI